MPPLRVATLITRLEGGAGLLALHGAAALDPADFEVTIVTGRARQLADQAAAANLPVTVTPALRTPIDPCSDTRALQQLKDVLRRSNFDVVHTHTAKAGALGRLAARQVGTPRIVHTYHGFPFHEFQSWLRRAAYVAVEQRLGRFTDVALCVGTGVAVEAVRRHLLPPDRIRTIGVVVDTTTRSACGPDARLRARRSLNLPLNATVVGAVGRLAYQKAPADFLEMMRLLGRPDAVGVWVGDGELVARTRRQATAQPHAPVVLLGQRADVLDVLPAFDVFVLPSRYEGLPTAVVEAMTCGVPVVATAVNAVADVVVPGETGLLVPPRRPDLLAVAVRSLLESPPMAARMAAAARERVAHCYGADALRDTLTVAYRG